MTLTEDALQPLQTLRHRRRRKPASGHPMLFALMLALASLGTLTLLVAGPALPLQLAIASALGLMVMVGMTWVFAGPRL